MWVPDQLPTVLVDLAAESLRQRSEQLDREQAVHGLDALPEVGFHPLLGAAFRAGGLGVWPEHPFPGPPGTTPRHRERERCDLVLTPAPDLDIRDPVRAQRDAESVAGTLFEQAAREDVKGVLPQDAFWVEVKLVGQYCYTHGVPGPNRAYSTELLRIAPGDIPKLSRDPGIRWGALLLILFTADREVAAHDLGVLLQRCLQKGLGVSAPARADFPVSDRIGNRLCTVAMFLVRGSA